MQIKGDIMKNGIALFMAWIAGVDLGLCLGNQAAGGAAIPQAWIGAFVLSACALIVIVAPSIKIDQKR